jgi:hypothetical protein
MKIFGKTLSEYVGFEKWILVLIAGVGFVRLALSLGGLPNSEVKWLSVTVMGLLGMVYCAVIVHTSNFGSYRQLLPLLVLQGTVGHVIVAGAILLAMATGIDNIYSAPEYSGGVDGKNWSHVGAHLLIGIVIGPLVSWLVASGIMFLVKKVARTPVPVAGH